jgi:hypothetical protein
VHSPAKGDEDGAPKFNLGHPSGFALPPALVSRYFFVEGFVVFLFGFLKKRCVERGFLMVNLWLFAGDLW